LFFPPCSLLAVIKLLKRALIFAKAGSILVLTPLSIPGLIPLSTRALTPQTLVRLTRALTLARALIQPQLIQALTLHRPTPARLTLQLLLPNS
jgi:hypothetical protein